MAGRRIDIDEKIERAQAEVTKAKKKYDETESKRKSKKIKVTLILRVSNFS